MQRLCRVDDIPEGRARGFDVRNVGRDDLFIVRHGTNLYAWRNECPHIDGAPLAWRKDEYLDAAGQNIVCWAHGAKFEIDSGLCVVGPCVGQALTPIPVTVEDGYIYLPKSPQASS